MDTEIYASHHQFFVADPSGRQRTDLVWDGGGLERHLGVVDDLVAIGTVGYCDVPVRIEVWDEEPPHDLDDWDHVVDATVEVRSGRLALGWVEGPADLEPLAVAPGTNRLRSSAAGLDDADEMDGGDRYRIQVWPAPAAEPEVKKWWAPWSPTSESRRTAPSGRILVGAEAHDRRVQMEWLASRGHEHLFRDDEGTLWEHSTLPDPSGTPQLEELVETEAEHRYGPCTMWGPPPMVRPSTAQTLKNLWQTWRYSRGWRPPRGGSS